MSLFSRKEKDKPAAITIETGEELKSLFDTIVVPVDLNKTVKEFILLLLATHQAVGNITESEYGLYTKESSHTLRRLDSNKTLKENRIRAKDALVFRKGVVAAEIRTSPRGHSMHQLSFREKFHKPHEPNSAPKLMRHNSSTSKIGPLANFVAAREQLTVSPPPNSNTTTTTTTQPKPSPSQQNITPTSPPQLGSTSMSRNPSGTFPSPSDMGRLVHRFSRTFSQSSKNFTESSESSRRLIFGVPIRASLSETDGPIPAAIQGCLDYIDENMLDIPKIFIQRADPTETEKLRRSLEEGQQVDLHKYSPYVISNLVLQYLEMLRDPLISNEIYKDLLSCEPGMLWRVTLLLGKLPEEHFYLLKRVLGVMRNVVDNGQKNGVTVDALAQTIGPLIMRPRNTNSSADLMSTLARTKDLAKTMLENYSTLLAEYASHNVPNISPGEIVVFHTEDVNCAHNTGSGTAQQEFSNGILWITNYQIIWKSTERESAHSGMWSDLRIPNRSVLYLERNKHPIVARVNKELYSGLSITCRNFRSETFVFSSRKHCKTVFKALLRHAFDEDPRNSFAFVNSETFIGNFNGWEVYKCMDEFKRLGLSSEAWRISDINKKFEFCDIYPKHLIVPAYIGDDILLECARNRERSRIPILVWKHPTNHAVLLRSGPTLNLVKVDANASRGDNDRSGNQLVEAVLINVLKSRQGMAELNNTVSSIEIADMGGPPPTAYYHYQCIQSIWFSDAPVPKNTQEKLHMLLDVVINHSHTSSGYEKQFEGCGYASYLRITLSSARKISQMLVSGVSVITQGSLTNSLDLVEFALVSLAMIMLDPFYRTIQGFMVLIEKEWCQYAFPFSSGKKNRAPEVPVLGKYLMKGELMPVFLLFIDCIWQIYKDAPDAFEFNTRLLIFLVDQSFCGRFGTFLGGIDRDSSNPDPAKGPKDRLNFKRALKTKTVSVWNYVNYHREQFLNPLFDANLGMVLPDMSRPINFRLWNSYYLRFTTSYKTAEYMKKIHAAKISGDTSLHLDRLNLPNIPVLSEDIVPVFRQLSHIQVLDLSYNYLNVCPADILYMPQLRKLNMLGNKLRVFPSATFLKHWSSRLEELTLTDNHITSLPVAAQLKKLSNLTILRMSSNRATDVVSVGSLASLKVLDLSNNLLNTIPQDITQLRYLQELALFKNHLKSLPDDLSGLVLLKNLSLAHNKLLDIPAGIYQLANLQILDLSHNNIENIPNEISRLQNLRIFNMSNNEVYLLPPALYQLGSLLDLDLSTNKIGEINPNVLHLSSLLRLAMQENKISDIPIEISGLHTLTELNLSHNELTELTPAIGQLSSLVKLDLQDNKITQLPQTLGNLAKTIRFLHVDMDKITNIPPEIIQKGNEAILSYLGEVMQSDKPAYRIKLMVVGRDNVGKTALTNCLRKKHKRFADNCNTLSTDGIDIDMWSFMTENEAGEKQKVDVNIWDMAGQEVYYTTHQFFLSEATIYVVVWNVVQGENSENGDTKIEYWLRTLKARCGDTIPPAIFVVGTHIDDPTIPRDFEKNLLYAQRARYKGLFPTLEMYFKVVSCMSGEGIDSLRKDIQAVVLKQKNMGRSLPSSWFLLEKCLVRERTKRIPPIMYCDEVRLLGQACGLSDTQTLHNALAWLHDTGNIILFNQDGGVFGTNDKGIVVLDPRWLSNTFTTIFTTRHQWARGGALLYEDLQHIWKPPVYPHHLHRGLLALAERFEIVLLLDRKQSLPIYDETNKTVRNIGRKPSSLSLASSISEEDTASTTSTPSTTPPSSTSSTPTNSSSNLMSASLGVSNNNNATTPTIDRSATEDILILVPSLLPATKPPTLSSLWPSAPQLGEAQVGRRYQLEFIPIGLFSRVMVRCLRLCKAKICWRDGILLESNEVTTSGESCEKILVEVIAIRKCIDVTGRSLNAGTVNVNFSLSRTILECIETLVKDYFRLPVRTFVPCIHCIMLNSTPHAESPPIYISSPETTAERSRKRTMSTPVQPANLPPVHTKVPYFFELEQCENAVVEGLTFINCNKNNTVTPVRLGWLAPDLTMSDFFGRRIEYCDIVPGKKIGEGGSASVYKADWNGKQVAVKKLKQATGMDSSGLRVDAMDTDAFSQTFHEFRREAYIMSGLSHPNLVQFEGLCLSPLCIVMEYLPNGNLYELLHSNEPLSWRMRIKISTDVATGMAYLHRGGIMHRDLKSPNVLMSGKKDSIVAKVTDFGLSGLSSIMSGRAVVNPVWLAPEVLKNIETPDATKIDVYAFGVILYEIATRKDFFGEENFMAVVEEKVMRGERPIIPSECPPIFAALIQACWSDDPQSRPSFSKICDDLVDVKTVLKQDGIIAEKETDEGETETPQGLDSEVADSSDDEERKGVRRTKSDGDVFQPKQ